MKRLFFILITCVLFSGTVYAEQMYGGLIDCEQTIEYVEYNPAVSRMRMRPQTIEEILYEGIANHNEYIDISAYDLTFEEAGILYIDFIHMVGELPINPSGVLIIVDESSGKVVGINPDYLYDEDEYSLKMSELEKIIEDICVYASEGDNDMEKALLAHDKIASDYYYDPYPVINSDGSKSYEIISHTAYGFLENGYAVCQGYCYLYGAVLDRMGIDNAVCISEAMGHMWSRVKIDGTWYHVDVTHDDQGEYVIHKNFLSSDATYYRWGHNSNDWYVVGDDSGLTCYDNQFESGYFFDNLIFPIRKEKGIYKFNWGEYEFNLYDIHSKGMIFSLPVVREDGSGSVMCLIHESYESPFSLCTVEYENGRYIESDILNIDGITIGDLQVRRCELPFKLNGSNSFKFMMIDRTTLSPVIDFAETGGKNGI